MRGIHVRRHGLGVIGLLSMLMAMCLLEVELGSGFRFLKVGRFVWV